ncbi:MAG: hypothetical protein DHS20C21_01760 [Gemmatimonadota bacterium]|nr:MAG: hypothetical protein DHS20C21_01760 [Gemmatimonadota bacterium]
MTRRFFYISMGIVALAAAYHLGATRTEAQGGGQFAGIAAGPTGTLAITTSGDVYQHWGEPRCDGTWYGGCPDGWTYMGSVLGGPVPTESQSFGAVKGMFK